MKTVKCPVCGKENNPDAPRCVECGQELDLAAGIGRIGNPTIDLSKRTVFNSNSSGSPQSSSESVIDASDEEREDLSGGDGSTGGKHSRLKSILSAKTKDADLESLLHAGLLPPEQQGASGSDLIRKEGPLISQNDSAGDMAGSSLPDWLVSTEFTQAEEQGSGGDGITRADLDASLGEIPDWVRRLQMKLEKRETGQTPTQNPQPEPVFESQSVDMTFPPGGDQLMATSLPMRKIEPNLVESVTSYITGLKNPRKPVPERSKRLSRISWGIIGLTMISLMAVMLWSGTSVGVTGEPVSADLEGLSSFIETISSEAVVLVGMEYDLPLAGEIENAAMPVLADLMEKQVNLVFLSTRPVGPAMSNHLIELGRNWRPDYPAEKSFVLAYLPGGAAGLLRFAIDPRDAIPVAADGAKLWLAPQLSNITKPSDFSMLLLLTDSSEAAKDWLEQVQPRMGKTPVFVVASNQAVPVLRPYFESGQINTIVEGISAAARYEKVHLVTTNNQILLRAYNSGLLFMAILLACIIILSMIGPRFEFRSRRKRHKNAPR